MKNIPRCAILRVILKKGKIKEAGTPGDGLKYHWPYGHSKWADVSVMLTYDYDLDGPQSLDVGKISASHDGCTITDDKLVPDAHKYQFFWDHPTSIEDAAAQLGRLAMDAKRQLLTGSVQYVERVKTITKVGYYAALVTFLLGVLAGASLVLLRGCREMPRVRNEEGHHVIHHI